MFQAPDSVGAFGRISVFCTEKALSLALGFSRVVSALGPENGFNRFLDGRALVKAAKAAMAPCARNTGLKPGANGKSPEVICAPGRSSCG